MWSINIGKLASRCNTMNCSVCGKTFSSRYNLNRHTKQHQERSEEDMDIERSEDEMERDGGSQSRSEDETSEESESDDSTCQSKVPPYYRSLERKIKAKELAEEKGNRDAMAAWNYVLLLQFGLDDMHNIFSEKENEQCELNAIRKRVNSLMRLTEQISDSPLYMKIYDEKARLESHNYDEDEADKVAWFNRRFRIKKYLKQVIEEFQNNEKASPSEKEEEEEVEPDIETDNFTADQ